LRTNPVKLLIKEEFKSLDSENPAVIWSLLIFIGAVIGLIGLMLGLSSILGQRHNDRMKGEPYEGGMIPTGSARLKFSVDFYLIAMFFVIFDLEAVFLIAWAISLREAGWFGFIGVAVFVFLLLVVLLYEWRIGALDIAPDGKKILKAMKKIREKHEVAD
jgi:NADH-quinone oxidoreductase subunit A